jgi:hypothetical protein
VKPRIGNGARRGLELLAAIGWAAFEDPTHPWHQLRIIERRELARALAWVDWKRTHNEKGQELELKPRARRRRHRLALEQTSLPLFTPENRQDVERAV